MKTVIEIYFFVFKLSTLEIERQTMLWYEKNQFTLLSDRVLKTLRHNTSMLIINLINLRIHFSQKKLNNLKKKIRDFLGCGS